MLAAGEIRSTILEVVQVKKLVPEVTTRLDFRRCSGNEPILLRPSLFGEEQYRTRESCGIRA